MNRFRYPLGELKWQRFYISHSQKDEEIAIQFLSELRHAGHEVVRQSSAVSPGQGWRNPLVEALKTADVLVVLLTASSSRAAFLQSEVGTARAFVETYGDKLIIPVLWDAIELPEPVKDLLAVDALDHNVFHATKQINQAIDAFYGRRAAEVQKEVEVKERIEQNVAVYVDEAVEDLKRRERSNRRRADIWYWLGYFTLIGGIGFGIYGVVQIATADQQWSRFAYLTLKSAIIIGLLLACSKYSFSLGKSYMLEALRSADRIHAIGFGRFYLRAYGLKTSWGELKEVFQNWNIDRPGHFAASDSNHFDPKFVEAFVEIAKALAAKSGK